MAQTLDITPLSAEICSGEGCVYDASISSPVKEMGAGTCHTGTVCRLILAMPPACSRASPFACSNARVASWLKRYVTPLALPGGAHIFPVAKQYSRKHTVAEHELHNEEQGVLEGRMRICKKMA